MALKQVVALVGGVGGAKLAHGLAQLLPPEALTIVVNTGDDFEHYGLHISPDMDTVTYTLAGLVDRVNGWGVAGDTTAMLDALRRFGEQPWFRLGDQDLAMHLLRTAALRSGERLTTITLRLTRALGVQPRILPMTDAPVRTLIDTVELGELEFQVYFVKHRWQPTLRGVRFAGIEDAQITPEVEDALRRADAVIIGPSNPWLSIDPILAVGNMRSLLTELDVPRVALTPIVAGQALKGPAAKLMAELGIPVTPRAVAEHYGTAINGFVYDERDAEMRFDGLRTTRIDTVMRSEEDRARVARQILEWMTSETFS